MPDPGSGAGLSRPALVASDLDGTLLHSDGTISARTADAWRRLASIGIPAVMVTARPPRWTHFLADLMGDHGTAICANGAFVYDVRDRKVLQSHTIDAAVVQELADSIRSRIPEVAFAAELATGKFIEPAYPEMHPEDAPAVVHCGPVSELSADAAVGKLLARAPGRYDEAFVTEVAEIVGDRAVVAYSGVGGLAEISAPGVTKAVGLARWAEALGIQRDAIWAFGDMPNDLPMLRWAGRSYAMANAHPLVHEAATHRCAANDDDGVAQVLEGL